MENIFDQKTVTRAVLVDQSPLGSSPRSTPATATGLLDVLRPLYAALPLSRQRGYTAARFSLNARGGRCERCGGTGRLQVDMNFLADLYTECDACHILLVMRLECFCQFCSLANADQKDSGSQRVQSSGVTDLKILLAEMTDSGVLDLSDHVRRCPSVWFVYRDNDSLRVVVDVSGKYIRTRLQDISFHRILTFECSAKR